MFKCLKSPDLIPNIFTHKNPKETCKQILTKIIIKKKWTWKKEKQADK